MNLTKDIYTITEVARLIGVSPDTIRLWIHNHKIPAEYVIQLPSRHRRLTRQGVMHLLQLKGIDIHKLSVVYARVSTSHQKDSLQNQVDSLVQWANSNGISVDDVITDIASGMNFSRPGLRKLIELSEQAKLDRIIIAYRDRLVRFGFDFFHWLFTKHGTDIIVVNNLEEQPNSRSEIIDDFVAIIHYFAMKLYGARTYKRKVSQMQNIIQETQHETTKNNNVSN